MGPWALGTLCEWGRASGRLQPLSTARSGAAARVPLLWGLHSCLLPCLPAPCPARTGSPPTDEKTGRDLSGSPGSHHRAADTTEPAASGTPDHRGHGREAPWPSLHRVVFCSAGRVLGCPQALCTVRLPPEPCSTHTRRSRPAGLPVSQSRISTSAPHPAPWDGPGVRGLCPGTLRCWGREPKASIFKKPLAQGLDPGHKPDKSRASR